MVMKTEDYFSDLKLKDKERTLLSWKACRLISKNSMIYMNYDDWETIQEFYGVAGFAEYYLKECWDQSQLINNADLTLYKQLLKIDAKIGVTQTKQLFECVFWTLRIDIIKVCIYSRALFFSKLRIFQAIDMDQVEFGYVGSNGFTIYNHCFQRYMNARYLCKRPEDEWKKLVAKTEIVFDVLVKEGIKHGFDVNSILEIPSSTGSTCFEVASQCSEKIANYIIERGIKVNSINTDMLIPAFKY